MECIYGTVDLLPVPGSRSDHGPNNFIYPGVIKAIFLGHPGPKRIKRPVAYGFARSGQRTARYRQRAKTSPASTKSWSDVIWCSLCELLHFSTKSRVKTTVESHSLDGDGSFLANRGLETIKSVSD